MQLAQQLADQCAIAIRQVRLYQSVQFQVIELEKLNHLKDEFLKTLSHKLRSPITSISLAAQTIETLLQRSGKLEQDEPTVQRLFKMLHQGCQRKTKMIADLLTLSHLDADSAPPLIEVGDLQNWLPAMAKQFEVQIMQHPHLRIPLRGCHRMLVINQVDWSRKKAQSDTLKTAALMHD